MVKVLWESWPGEGQERGRKKRRWWGWGRRGGE